MDSMAELTKNLATCAIPMNCDPPIPLVTPDSIRPITLTSIYNGAKKRHTAPKSIGLGTLLKTSKNRKTAKKTEKSLHTAGALCAISFGFRLEIFRKNVYNNVANCVSGKSNDDYSGIPVASSLIL